MDPFSRRTLVPPELSLSIDLHDASRPAAAGREIAWPRAPGEMAERVRTFAWDQTPLGPITEWPGSLKTIVDLALESPLPMTVHWGPRQVQIYNDAARDVFGRRHPQALGRSWDECWGDIKDPIAPIHARVMAGEAVVLADQPWTYPRHGGAPEDVYFTSHFVPLRDELGGVAGFIVTAVETTSEVRGRAQLRRSEGYLAAILRQAPVGVAVFDTDGRLVMGNAALDRFEIEGAPPDGAQAPRWRAFRADGSSLAADYSPVALALGGAVTMPGVDFLHRRGNGAEVWIRVSAAPLRDDEGGVYGVVATYEDIDQQRRYEDRLRSSEERFRRFVENSVDVIWIYDAVEARLEYVSPGFQRIWGIAPEQVVADRDLWAASVHPEDRGAVVTALQQVLSGGKTVSHEYRIVRPDGAVRRIRDTGFPIRDAAGHIVQAAGVAQDVTRDASPAVYLIDPDPQTRTAKAELLREAGRRVTAFASEQAFLEVAAVLTPGCVVVRTEDRGAARFDLVGALKARRISLPVILETTLGGDVASAISAMKAGAADLLEAPCGAEALLSAVASALAGLGEVSDDDDATQQAQMQVALMSSREREVLEGLLSGGTNKTIARHLGISPRTVENHRARVMERLGAHTLPEAVLAAASAGMKPTRRPRSNGGPG
jgi:PAS domain S-box-containing protein